MLRFIKQACLAGALLFAAGQTIVPSQAADYPDKSVTWLIPYGAGGGTDLWSRLAGQIMNRDHISDATFIYENRTGGSGVRGFNDLINQYKGNDYVLMPFDPVIFVPWLAGEIKQNYKDVTIIAAMAYDRHILLVQADSPFKTVADLVNAKDHVVTVGSGPAGVNVARVLMNVSGFKPRIVRFEGDGKTIAALLGGHVEAAFANPSEALGQLQAGTLRAIAIAGPARNKVLPDVPTFKEQGYDVVFGMPRGVAMAPGVSDTAKNYWRAKFKELANTDAWKKEYIDKFALDGEFLDSEVFVKQLDEVIVPQYKVVIDQNKKAE